MPAADTMAHFIERSVQQRLDGNHTEAARLAQLAIEAHAGTIPAEVHVEAALAHAANDQLDLAADHFSAAYSAKPNPDTYYHLGSVLACQGKLHQANRIFSKSISIPIGATEETSTDILQFHDLDAERVKGKTEPFSRSTIRFPQELKGKYELVMLVACDAKYLRLFGEAYLNSVIKNCSLNFCVHFHIVNPMQPDLAYLETLAEAAPCPVEISAERITFPSLPESGQKTYYSCARFMVAPEVRDFYKCPMLVADVDQMVVGNLDKFVAASSSHDIALIKYPNQVYNLLSLFSASVLFFNANEAAGNFLRELRTYLLARMLKPKNLTWHLDQAAIACVYLRNPNLNYHHLDPKCMHSAIDGSSDIPDSATFWSITYHIAENNNKLHSKAFKKFSNPRQRIEQVSRASKFAHNPPMISIVMPVYNGANYVREAIESAIAQSWPNTEIIVVNDGSNDNGATAAVIDSFGTRVRSITQENGGVASALNTGIKAMRGDVFCWLSHDDLHMPEKTELQVKKWASLNYDNVILYSDYQLINADGEKISDVVMNHAMLEEKPVYALFRAAIHGCSIFVPRELFQEVGDFDTNLPTTQDYDLWARMILRFPFVHMPNLLVKSRWHDEQGSKTMAHQGEATGFWTGMLSALPAEEQILLEGSTYNFLQELASFLSANNVNDAAANAEALAQEQLQGPLVSVVIPVFNRYELATSAIDSALNQTHKNIEVIVVDDGSSDDHAILDEVINSRGPKVSLIRQTNSGAGAARNAGCRAATGEYIAFLDSDDLFLPNKVEQQLATMESTGVVMSHTSYWRHTESSNELEQMNSGASMDGCVFPQILASCAIATPTVMIRKEVLAEGVAFPENSAIGEDVMCWIQIASRHEIAGIETPLTIVRTGGESAAYNKKSQQAGHLYIMSEIINNPELCHQAGSIDSLRQAFAQLCE